MKPAGLFLTFLGTLLPVLVALLVIQEPAGMFGLLGVVAATASISWMSYRQEGFFFLVGMFILILGMVIAAAVYVLGPGALWGLVFCVLIPVMIEP